MRSPKTIAAFPSSYIPWKGYFDVINSVDEFVLYDDAPYAKRDWRNRNVIKGPRGLTWLAIPVDARAGHRQRVRDTRVTDTGWRVPHWRALRRIYSTAPHFKTYAWELRQIYARSDHGRLSQVNHDFIKRICQMLGIDTRISWSMDYRLPDGDPHEKLIELCRQSGAGRFLAGNRTRRYLDVARFEQADIEVSFADYARYPSYRQVYPPFEHRVSVLDLLFHTGPDAHRYMKSFGRARLVDAGGY